jgi:hypothetical protein
VRYVKKNLSLNLDDWYMEGDECPPRSPRDLKRAANRALAWGAQLQESSRGVRNAEFARLLGPERGCGGEGLGEREHQARPNHGVLCKLLDHD